MMSETACCCSAVSVVSIRHLAQLIVSESSVDDEEKVHCRLEDVSWSAFGFFFGAALVFIPCLSDQMMDEHSIYQHDERNVIFFTVVTCGFTFDFSFCLRSSIVVVVFFSFLNLFLLFNWRLIPSSFTTMLLRASGYGRVCRLDLCWICLNQQLTVRLYLIARKEPTILSITKKMRF